jgi:hypothetical protein
MTTQGADNVDVFCPRCAYNLRGVASAVCPECGRAFDRAELRSSRLPWVQRQRIGWWAAYWRTVAMVTFAPNVLLAELAVPVSIADAKRFWAWTVLHAWAPVGMALAAATVTGTSSGGVRPSGPVAEIGAAWPLVLFALGALAWLFAATGAATYFCHPRRLDVERQDRAIAIGYYACAPLAVLAPGSVVVGLMVWTARHRWNELTLWAAILAIAVVISAGFMTYLRTLRIVRVAAERSRGFVWAMAIGLPVLWAALFVLLALLLPLMLCYAVLFATGRSA